MDFIVSGLPGSSQKDHDGAEYSDNQHQDSHNLAKRRRLYTTVAGLCEPCPDPNVLDQGANKPKHSERD